MPETSHQGATALIDLRSATTPGIDASTALPTHDSVDLFDPFASDGFDNAFDDGPGCVCCSNGFTFGTP